MFQLIYGVAGTGKSTWALEALKARAAAGQAGVLLVPEQFSSSAEGMVYRHLGARLSAFAEVLSFRTLAERILRYCGGLALPVLDEAQRAVYVRRALDDVAAQLAAFARQRRSAAFCSLCAHTLAELKTAGASPQLLRAIADEIDDDKLREIALIFDAYETRLAGSALDPDDRLSLAAKRADCGWLNGKAVYADSFDGFTAPEYALLEEVMRHAEGLYVTLCCDVLVGAREAPDLFTPVRRAAAALQRRAGRAGLRVGRPVCLSSRRRHEAPGLDNAARLLEGEALPDGADSAGIRLTEAADEWEEVRAAAAEMRRLALAGVPYGKMALVCRDVAAYESVVRRQFALFDIPYFTDAAGTIEHTAPVAFLRAALGLLRDGLGSSGVLALLKTGLCGCGQAELAALENYVFTWSPKAEEWRAPFAKNPEGLLARMDEAACEQLAAAERLRGAALPRIEEFLRATRGKNARAVSKNLYLLMDRFKAAEHAEEAAALLEAEGDAGFAEASRRAWDVCMQLLDEMAALLGEEAVSAAEYDELLLVLLRSTSFAQAPQTLECALFSGADRMRLAEPDYCFVVGAAEGEFPMQVGYSGLLTHNDRDALVAGGVEMPGSFENRSLLEDMFFYRALCAPRKGLYISWPKRRAGAAKSMSAALEPIAQALAPPPLRPAAEDLAATPAAAFDLLGGVWRDDSPLAASLHAALAALPEWADSLALLNAVDNPGAFTVPNPALISRLVGRDMTLSATVAEQFYQCRFSYYLGQVLRVRPRRKAELSPMESGTFVHHVLEQVTREAGAGFAALGDDALAAMARRHAEEFIAEYLPADTRRSAWQLSQIINIIHRLLCFLRDAAAGSDFTMDAVELEIGEGGLAPLTVIGPDGSSVRVVGKVDRVDVLHRDGNSYLCILDYKTGDKELDLNEVYCGLNMQMMIYVDALCENGASRYPNPVPAGALYLSGDPAPASGSRHEAASPPFRFSGLLLADGEVLRALDRSGEFAALPVRLNKDGSFSKFSRVATREGFDAIRAHVRGLLGSMAAEVKAGSFGASPTVHKNRRPCNFCPYRAACRHEDGKNEREVAAPEGAFGEGVAL